MLFYLWLVCLVVTFLTMADIFPNHPEEDIKGNWLRRFGWLFQNLAITIALGGIFVYAFIGFGHAH